MLNCVHVVPWKPTEYDVEMFQINSAADLSNVDNNQLQSR